MDTISRDIRDLPSDPTPSMLVVLKLVDKVLLRLPPKGDWLPLKEGQIVPEGAEIAVSDQGSCTLGVARQCLQVSGNANAEVKVTLESDFPECLHLATNCCKVEVPRYEIMTSAGMVNVSSILRG